MKRSTAWKALELEAARVLGGRRVTTPWTLFERRVDVEVPDFPDLKVDCKHRQRFSHHSLLRTIWRKYCRRHEVPVLISKTAGARGAVVSLPLADFAAMLDEIRAARAKGDGRE